MKNLAQLPQTIVCFLWAIQHIDWSDDDMANYALRSSKLVKKQLTKAIKEMKQKSSP